MKKLDVSNDHQKYDTNNHNRITEAVGHIFRRKAISHKLGEYRSGRCATKPMAGNKRKRNEERVGPHCFGRPTHVF